MTNVELLAEIKFEIDKRYAEYREKMKSDDFTYYKGMADALDFFEQFIDILEAEKPVPSNLFEAKHAFSKKRFPDEKMAPLRRAARIGYEAGAEWQKEQMMKGALNGWLDEDNEPPYNLNVVCEEKVPFGKFKHCDKVRIIIVKEDSHE